MTETQIRIANTGNGIEPTKTYDFYVKREVEGNGCERSFSWNGARWLSEVVAESYRINDKATEFLRRGSTMDFKETMTKILVVKDYTLSRSWRKHLER